MCIRDRYIAVHGYSLNHAARSLKLNRSDTIGFVVPDLSNAFFARLMAALEALCRKRNLLLLTVASHEDPALENRAIASLLARGVDGLVVAPCQAATLPQLLKYKARKSIVMFDRDFRTARFPTVFRDNFQGGLEMTRRMLREPGTPFPFLCELSELPSIQERIRGFLAACDEQGVRDSGALLRRQSEGRMNAGQQMMHQLINELNGPPPAFMCSSVSYTHLVADEADIVTEVFVFPFPLMAGDLDRQFRFAGIFHRCDQFGRRPSHADQDQARDDGLHLSLIHI